MRRPKYLTIIAIAALVVLLIGAGCGSDSQERLDEFAGYWESDVTRAMHIVVVDEELRFAPDSSLQNGSLEVDGDRLSISLEESELGLTLDDEANALTGTLTSAGQTFDVEYERRTEAEYQAILVSFNEATLAGWIQQWQSENGRWPSGSDVTPEGSFGQRFEPWPENPYTGETMRPGTDPGEYRYRPRKGGYRLIMYEADGELSRTVD